MSAAPARNIQQHSAHSQHTVNIQSTHSQHTVNITVNIAVYARFSFVKRRKKEISFMRWRRNQIFLFIYNYFGAWYRFTVLLVFRDKIEMLTVVLTVC